MSDSSKFSGITTKLGLSPLEVPQVVHSKTGGLTIGIPKERTFQEHRVSWLLLLLLSLLLLLLLFLLLFVVVGCCL